MCLGILEGYVQRRDGVKISFNPKSTKLITIFAPWDEEIHLPFELGAEDLLAFRLPPHQLGCPVRWMRLLFNIDGREYDKTAIRDMIDSGDWPTQLTEHMRDECAKVAQYNIRSLNAQDIIEQKWLYIKAFMAPSEYKKDYFLSLIHI